MLEPTAYCPRCKMFVMVDRDGRCDSCRDRIVFLQNNQNNYAISNGEMMR